MAFGINVVNDGGQTQVDELFASYAIDESGSFVISPGGVGIVSITDRGQEPLVFLSLGNDTQWVVPMSIAALSFQVNPDDNRNTGQITVSWFTAHPANLLSSIGTYGMMVNDASGNRTFDSRFRYPRVRQIISAATLTSSAANYTVNAMPNGARPYFCMNTIMGCVGRIDDPGNAAQSKLEFPSIRLNFSTGVISVLKSPLVSTSRFVQTSVSFGHQLIMAESPKAA